MTKTFLDGWLNQKTTVSEKDLFSEKEKTKSSSRYQQNDLNVNAADVSSPKRLFEALSPISTSQLHVGLYQEKPKQKENFDNVENGFQVLSPPSSSSADEQQISVPSRNLSLVRSGSLDLLEKSEESGEPIVSCFSLNASETSMLDQALCSSISTPELVLENKKFVVTGLFSCCSREDMEHHIKRMGGQVMSSVSGRTDYLITGSILENNKPIYEGSKFKKAKELLKKKNSHLHILTEEEFLKLHPLQNVKLGTPIESQLKNEMPSSTQTFSVHHTRLTQKKDLGNDRDKTPKSLSPETLEQHSQHMLWAEKYRPQRSSDILGNSEVIRKLHNWLHHWYEICISKTHQPLVKSRGTGRFSDTERSDSRVCLLSGLPGIGKTTAARTVARENQYEILEFNSSDDRGKNVIEVIQDMTSGGRTLDQFLFKNESGVLSKKVLLIMDEIDGLSSGDRGGAQALLKLIDSTLCPVICICNDRLHPKVRTIASRCYDLRFSKPPKNIVTKRVCEIARQENLSLEYNAVEMLCERVGNDLRQILNTLQFMRYSPNFNHTITFDQMHQYIGYGLKDNQVMTNIFDMARKLLSRHESQHMSFNDKLDGYFVDYDLIPLQIQENYVNAFANISQQTHYPKQCYETLASVADSFTFGDMLNKKVRKDGYWNFLSDIGFFTTVLPSCQASGFATRIDFSQWLGKNSTTSRNRRLLGEIFLCVGFYTTTCLRELQTSGYLNVLYQWILTPLLVSDMAQDPKAGVRKCLDRMEHYGLTKQQVFENLNFLRFKHQVKVTDCLDTSTKRLLTTLFKNQHHALRINPYLFKAKEKSIQLGGATSETIEEGDIEEGLPLKEVVPESEPKVDHEGSLEYKENSEDDMNSFVTVPAKKAKRSQKVQQGDNRIPQSLKKGSQSTRTVSHKTKKLKTASYA